MEETVMNNIQKKPLVIYLALFAVLTACQIKTTHNPTNTIETEHTLAPSLRAASTQISPKDGMVAVYVPAGEFEMGSEDGDYNERPTHMVYLDAFWIDQTEVTNAMFAQFLNNMGSQKVEGENWLDSTSEFTRISRTNDTWQADEGYANHPVVKVTWHGANSYCEWTGRRLPTEAEWEKAARGIDGRTYPWGESTSCRHANYGSCDKFPTTSPVGYYGGVGASPYGAFDMAGNVWEWVDDWYDKDYYGGSPVKNPTGPDSGTWRVLRGGCCYYDVFMSRSAFRYYFPDEIYDHFIGFRCASSS